MALITCPDCGSSVSDQAEKCPSCSRPHPALTKAEMKKEESDVLLGLYVLGFIMAWIIFFIKNGFAMSISVGLMVSLLSWIYVLYAALTSFFG